MHSRITTADIGANISDILSGDTEAIGVVIPEQYRKNIGDFERVLAIYRFHSKIHTVMKVNSSLTLLKTARAQGCRVDVSSRGELEKALQAGYDGGSITANGPKNHRFLIRSVEEGTIISVDSMSEIQSLIALIPRGRKQKILLRLGGFDISPNTRFGILKPHWQETIDLLSDHREIFDIQGIAFHNDTRDINIRKMIFWEAFECFLLLKRSGFAPGIINIGGGYGVEYHDDISLSHQSCNRFQLGSRLYPQNKSAIGVDFLEHFLSDVGHYGIPIGKFLEENHIELWIEPGRSLLKGVGYAATRVIACRSESSDVSLVLDTNSFSLGMREEELPTDPFLLSKEENTDGNYFLLGNLCLESDIFFSRAVHMQTGAGVGDIVIFPDIGAYHMDFFETQSISHPKKTRWYQQGNLIVPDIF